MLKLKHRPAQSFKCPHHPRQQYGDNFQSPQIALKHCNICADIQEVYLRVKDLEYSAGKASRWISRGEVKKLMGKVRV